MEHGADPGGAAPNDVTKTDHTTIPVMLLCCLIICPYLMHIICCPAHKEEPICRGPLQESEEQSQAEEGSFH
jgi:hypothetical protein